MEALGVLRGHLRHDVLMSQHTSWRVGGLVRTMYQPADLLDLQNFLASLPADEPVYVVGLGSNLLVRDGGLDGTVVLMHGGLRQLSLLPDGRIYVEAGVPGAKVARFAALHQQRGAEFFAGIPGTMGGMLAMNAGCYGSETWDKVVEVKTLNRRGELFTRKPSDYEIGYRHVCPLVGQDELFVAATLVLEAGDGDASRAEIKTLLQKRIDSQPLHLPNAGSVFRNPPGDYAARLIESCGLKGYMVGGAQVSEKHANFIVNKEQASAADIENLIQEVQTKVAAQTGVQLMCEVRIVGKSPV